VSSSVEHTIEFIRETFSSKEFIPLHEPRFYGNEKKYLNEAIDSTYVSSVGPFVDRFENEIAAMAETEFGVAAVNGTAALQVALKLAGVNEGDEVITQALSFVATANSIKYNGAEPIFLDVDLGSMGLSPAAVQAFLEEYGDLREDGTYNKQTSKRIAACVPMHTFGFPADMDALLELCNQWKIPLVEDAAESIGSYYKGRACGSMGMMGVYSFNGNKIITSGGGGAIVTNDGELARRAKHLTTTAKVAHPYEYEHDELGFNFRMPNINAALICAQLEQLEAFIQAKRRLAEKYIEFFGSMDVKFRVEEENTFSNYWLMAVELENRDQRESFLQSTNDAGVMTRPIWKLLYKLPMYSSCFRDEQTNAQYLEDRIVNIPSSVIDYE